MFIVFLQYLLFLNVQTINYSFFTKTFYFIVIPLSLSSHPLIFLYVKYLTKESFKIRWKSIIHFLPAILLFLISTVLILFLTPEEQQLLFAGKSLNNTSENPILYVYAFSTIILFVQILVYAVIMFKLLYKHDENVEQLYSVKNQISLQWLKVFVILYTVYYLFEFLLFIFQGIAINETVYYSIISLHVFVVGLFALKQRDIYIKHKRDLLPEISVHTIEKELEHEHEKKEEIRTVQDQSIPFTEEEKKEILDKLEFLMMNEQLFLDANLSLYDLSQKLGIHKNYLSRIINEYKGMNFYNYVNEFRMETAKKLLLDPNFNSYSIEGIAKNSGFKSRSVFYPVFKKFIGLTPSEFRKKNLNH
jgi:AraC-like DNA-binding protein